MSEGQKGAVSGYRNESQRDPRRPERDLCLIKYGLYVIPSGFEVKGFSHPPLRGPPSPKGRLTDTEAVLFSVSVFNFQLSILSFQFYLRRKFSLLPFPLSLTNKANICGTQKKKPPYGGFFHLGLRRGKYCGFGKRDEGRGDYP